jgi:mono/diheme cytochrome c family protein
MRTRGKVVTLLGACALALSVAVGACANQAPSGGATGDVAAGQTAFTAKTCSGCHGANAEGAIGPKLAGTGKSQTQVLNTVRKGEGQMPAFDASKVSDQDVANIYAWLQSKK